tara:strand:- start:10146 stop:10292 length:147 start_codon:yes stop_codon:yes gene_type:complete
MAQQKSKTFNKHIHINFLWGVVLLKLLRFSLSSSAASLSDFFQTDYSI